MIAYLSGAMENARDEGSAWRDDITIWLKDNLKHSVIDPVIETAKLVETHKSSNYRDWKKSNPGKFKDFVKLCIDNDLNAVINKCDYVICLWNKDVLAGGGTHGEVTMAYYFNKPVYLINQLDDIELSGWISSCSTDVYKDFKSMKNNLLKVYR